MNRVTDCKMLVISEYKSVYFCILYYGDIYLTRLYDV